MPISMPGSPARRRSRRTTIAPSSDGSVPSIRSPATRHSFHAIEPAFLTLHVPAPVQEADRAGAARSSMWGIAQARQRTLSASSTGPPGCLSAGISGVGRLNRMPRYAFRRPPSYLPRRKSNAGCMKCEKWGLEIRRLLLPVIATPAEVVADVEQRVHVAEIERLLLALDEGRRNRGQIEVHAVATALAVHAVDIAA